MGSDNTPLTEWLDARFAEMDAKSEARHKELEKKLGDIHDVQEYMKHMSNGLMGLLNKVIDKWK